MKDLQLFQFYNELAFKCTSSLFILYPLLFKIILHDCNISASIHNMKTKSKSRQLASNCEHLYKNVSFSNVYICNAKYERYRFLANTFVLTGLTSQSTVSIELKFGLHVG